MSRLTIPVPENFDLARAVCSYGYFLLAPNRWDAGSRTLFRPLRGEGDRIIHAAVRQPRTGVVAVECEESLSAGERAGVKRGVMRMLRLDEDPAGFARFHRLHAQARRARFARLFRSPDLFEDIVKTMTGCNVTWPNTMRMNVLLCEKIGGGAFPTPGQLAAVRPGTLKKLCKVGYRAERIVRLARDVVSGRRDLAAFEDPGITTGALADKLREIYGVGPYAAANLCQLLGRYDRLAIDSETYRHFRQFHGVKTPKNPLKLHKRIERHYAVFAPFQFLAYWFELWVGYEKRAGDARQWDAAEHGPTFTASVLNREEVEKSRE